MKGITVILNGLNLLLFNLQSIPVQVDEFLINRNLDYGINFVEKIHKLNFGRVP
jgi:hypothetical protein